MDSINRNQPEDTHKNVSGTEAAKRIQERTDDAERCFFCTSEKAGESQGVRPMSV